MRRASLILASIVFAAVAAACTGGAPYDVTAEVVSSEGARDLLVVAPEGDGPWPVVVAYHGIDGTADDMAELATRLAREGTVVFAPTYGTDLTTMDGAIQMATDAECGYRFARSLAPEYGGDLDEPVTILGWSLGASAALGVGMTPDLDPTGEGLSCFEPVPRPDIVVAVSGCHYEGGQLDLVDTESWGNEGADIILLAGEDDTECEPSQTEDAATELGLAGYDPELIVLEGANHYAPVFHDVVGGEFVVAADRPAGERVVDVVMDAIAAR